MNLNNVKTLEELKLAKTKFYGPNSELKKLQNSIKKALPEDRGLIGQKITKLKHEIEKIFIEKSQEIINNKILDNINSQWCDVTAPITSCNSIHPLTLVANRFRDWLKQNGYFESKGSEIESDEYNFERLNIPKNHPARDMQDSLYINESKLLRTHNTGFTARELKENINQSFSHFVIGNVYRNDEDDQTHSHQFIQVDFVSVGDVSFANLIWTLKNLMSYVFEKEVKIRMRPSYFPFTEPSVEVDVLHQGKWMEILGAGMLNNNVLLAAGYNNNMNAFAAGIGIERIAMIKYAIPNIREFYTNDLRFIAQYKGVK